MSAYPADHTLPVGASVSGLELLRQTLEVINPEAVVTREDVAGQVTLEAVPVVTFSLPLLQPRQSRQQVWVTPPSSPPTTAGEETRALILQPQLQQTLHRFTVTENNRVVSDDSRASIPRLQRAVPSVTLQASSRLPEHKTQLKQHKQIKHPFSRKSGKHLNNFRISLKIFHMFRCF